MGIYQRICYKAEDLFVKLLTKDQDNVLVKEKVQTYRSSKEAVKEQKRMKRKLAAEERQQQLEVQKAKEKQEIENLLNSLVNDSYTTYEFNEVKNNKAFFQSLIRNVFEPDEKGLTFLFCEFDKSSKKEIKGYLIATNKRVWFVNKSFSSQQKFRYQTIRDIKWFNDGMLEKGLYMQYGVKRHEFDEIFDKEQMIRVANKILAYI
ncbi:PH domain-containing protein [Fictibacillus sp. 7GRE50]|uniref:PH domain-containing protein n=1 Tax=Fictibacillus sp. 7GRE50 TaxID=2745878 RepID=UPI0018CCC80E|nr:PH domain-containing protein [Fictibacillus sp. 7GRE50]MBH0166746.1 PH domain-containing protein [Fictibacillus sp. 7GRE50]